MNEEGRASKAGSALLASEKPNSFTLIETLAVTVLLAVLIGTTVIGLPGIAHRERLESALVSVVQFDGVARTQALACGQPRMLVFPKDRSRVEIMEPVSDGGRINWKLLVDLRYDDQVRVVDVIQEGKIREEPTAESQRESVAEYRVMIRGDGHSATYAVVSETGDGMRSAVIIDGRTGLGRSTDLGTDLDERLFDDAGGLCD